VGEATGRAGADERMTDQPAPRRCFVIMPFVEQLHYFYLALKYHVEQSFNLVCERADEQTLTVPLLDKIRDFIVEADVVIADLTGRNANVFYELGIAHTFGKPVILITSDDQGPPSDVRHFEYIRYSLGEHVQFFARLDNALRNVLFRRYDALYRQARTIYQEFRQQSGLDTREASKETFLSSVMVAERTTGVPSPDDTIAMAEFLLPRIVANASDRRVMSGILRWLSDRGQAGPT
jgi:hypothetical protein